MNNSSIEKAARMLMESSQETLTILGCALEHLRISSAAENATQDQRNAAARVVRIVEEGMIYMESEQRQVESFRRFLGDHFRIECVERVAPGSLIYDMGKGRQMNGG